MIWVSYELTVVPANRMLLVIQYVLDRFGLSSSKRWKDTLHRLWADWSGDATRETDALALRCRYGLVNGRTAYEECAACDQPYMAIRLVERRLEPVYSRDLAALQQLFGGRTAKWRLQIRAAVSEACGHRLPAEVLDLIVAKVLCPPLELATAV